MTLDKHKGFTKLQNWRNASKFLNWKVKLEQGKHVVQIFMGGASPAKMVFIFNYDKKFTFNYSPDPKKGKKRITIGNITVPKSGTYVCILALEETPQKGVSFWKINIK